MLSRRLLVVAVVCATLLSSLPCARACPFLEKLAREGKTLDHATLMREAEQHAGALDDAVEAFAKFTAHSERSCDEASTLLDSAYRSCSEMHEKLTASMMAPPHLLHQALVCLRTALALSIADDEPQRSATLLAHARKSYDTLLADPHAKHSKMTARIGELFVPYFSD